MIALSFSIARGVVLSGLAVTAAFAAQLGAEGDSNSPDRVEHPARVNPSALADNNYANAPFTPVPDLLKGTWISEGFLDRWSFTRRYTFKEVNGRGRFEYTVHNIHSDYDCVETFDNKWKGTVAFAGNKVTLHQVEGSLRTSRTGDGCRKGNESREATPEDLTSDTYQWELIEAGTALGLKRPAAGKRPAQSFIYRFEKS